MSRPPPAQGPAAAMQPMRPMRALAASFAQDRPARQRRRELDRADFTALAATGFLDLTVPTQYGGRWNGVRASLRTVCDLLRVLASGDSSVALVASMHPAVLFSGRWLSVNHAPAPFTEAWEQQCRWVFDTVLQGHWWGTIASEAGSGGDSANTRAAARRSTSGEYALTGSKHFGTGSGVTSFMITTAIPERETGTDAFVLDVRDIPFDGSRGAKLRAPWDGHGMIATQSHAIDFDEFPATRTALPSTCETTIQEEQRPLGLTFCAVIVGIVETAAETLRTHLGPRRESMYPFERVEWARIEQEVWLVQQAYAGMLRSAEEQTGVQQAGRLGKLSIAQLAESVLQRICRLVGGAAYSRRLPYGFWLADVQALGYLRPPWSLAHDGIFGDSWEWTPQETPGNSP